MTLFKLKAPAFKRKGIIGNFFEIPMSAFWPALAQAPHDIATINITLFHKVLPHEDELYKMLVGL